MSAPPPDINAKACAICGKSQHARFKPFCSKRCADVDLGRWLKGGYAIPAGPADEGEATGNLPDSEEE